MADLSKLQADIADLSAKVDGLIAKVNAPAPTSPDEQPAVDALAEQVVAISNKIPA